MSETPNLPAIAPDAAAMVRIKSEIDISDRSRLVTFGDAPNARSSSSRTAFSPRRRTRNSGLPVSCSPRFSVRRVASTRRV